MEEEQRKKDRKLCEVEDDKRQKERDDYAKICEVNTVVFFDYVLM